MINIGMKSKVANFHQQFPAAIWYILLILQVTSESVKIGFIVNFQYVKIHKPAIEF